MEIHWTVQFIHDDGSSLHTEIDLLYLMKRGSRRRVDLDSRNTNRYTYNYDLCHNSLIMYASGAEEREIVKIKDQFIGRALADRRHRQWGRCAREGDEEGWEYLYSYFISRILAFSVRSYYDKITVIMRMRISNDTVLFLFLTDK